MNSHTQKTVDFIHGLSFDHIEGKRAALSIRALTDTLGVAVGGSTTDLSRIIRSHAVGHFAAGPATKPAHLFCDGRPVSAAGAALANGMTIDALDAHDGLKPTKGHVGCGVVASLMALAEANGVTSGHDLLTALVVGYEVGSRAGIALHATVSDYHTSGAWIALGAAAMGARLMGLASEQTLEALGIEEYHGPRSQMMRCIDHPTMVKDGSGWGAMAGVSGAYLARDGFTGAPAISLTEPEVRPMWDDIGNRWYIAEQYIKLYPVCRWAQPAVEAALALKRKHAIVASSIARIDVTTFAEAARLTARHPATTEEAQYSLPFPLAAALVYDTVGAKDVAQEGLTDPVTRPLRDLIHMRTAERYDAEFPARRFADVAITLKDGTVLKSAPTEAIGDPEDAVDKATIDAKFHSLAKPVLGAERAAILHAAIEAIEHDGDFSHLISALSEPV
ncbi:MAG: MmgE/PrpD family protein [Pseudomonadota bacterium]